MSAVLRRGGGRRRRPRRIYVLERLADWTYDYPWRIVLLGVLVAAVSLAVTVQWLAFQTSRDDLISDEEEYVRIYKDYQREFGDTDDLVIVLESEDLSESKAAAREIAERLERDPAAARAVLYRIDPAVFGGKALLYLSAAELTDLRRKLISHGDLVDRLAADPGLVALLRQINREISSALVGHLVSSFLGTPSAEEEVETAPLDLALLDNLIRSLGDALEGRPYRPLWRAFLRPGSDLDEDGFLVDDSRRFAFVLITAPEDTSVMASAAEAIERVRSHIRAARARHPEVRIGITGGPALATQEMQASVTDTSLASVLSLLGVGVCFILFYRDIARPFLAVFTLSLGLAWSFGYITATIGHLTILSVVFATILIGMSDDFGVHLISRFEEETERGHSIRLALRRTFVHSGGGIISGAITFAVAFFAMTLTNFRGMAELGFIGGGGMLLCLVAMLTVFPASLVLYERWKARWLGGWVDAHLRIPERLARWRPHVIDRLYRHPHLMVASAAVMTVLGLWTVPQLRLDLNLLNLQARGTEAVEWEREILSRANRSSWYAVSVVPTIDAARRLETAYGALPEVGRVESLASLIPEDQDARMAAVRALRPAVETLPSFAVPAAPVDAAALHGLLQAIRFKLQDGGSEKWDPARKPDEAALEAVRKELARVEPMLDGADPQRLSGALTALQERMFQELVDQVGFLKRNLTAAPITADGLPALLKKRFVAPSGRLVVQVFPRHNIWERQQLGEFVSALRRVDPQVTGGPVSFFETSRLMRDGYIDAGLYALAVICVIVLYDFRSLTLAALALVPLVVGAVWTAGVMWLANLQFNLANLIILPLIVGIGISNGIHIIHRHIEDGSHEMSVIARSTGKAVVLSSVTTMVGFGSLMVARHQGIFSLGLLLTIGIGCNLLASITVLPSLLSYLPAASEEGRPAAVPRRRGVGASAGQR